MDELSLEEKIGQLLMVHFHGKEANEEARSLIQDLAVGGVIYYNWSNGLDSPEQVRHLSCGLQSLAETTPFGIPLLIAVDQEGGVVARLTHGFTRFPGNRALGETGDRGLAYSSALAIGRELRAVGVNMNLAPVVDVNSNPRNPIIGIRSFGQSPQTVTAFAEKALDGYQEAGMIATLKHFPGHGDTEIDSHHDLPVVRKSLEELEKTELFPFRRCAPLAPVVMTAHLLIPSFDADCCSTVSSRTLSYLRNEIGFQGVIMADSLVMQGVLKKCGSVDEAAIQALNAGCDLLLLGGKQLNGEHFFELTVTDVKRIHGAIVKSVRENRISEQKVNEAVARILALKREYLTRASETTEVDSGAHNKLARDIASRALKMVRKTDLTIDSLQHKRALLVAPELLKDSIGETSLVHLFKETSSSFFTGLNPSDLYIKSVLDQAEETDAVLVCSYNAWKNPGQAALIRALIAAGKSVILIVARDDLDASLFSGADLILKIFSPTLPALQAACDELYTQMNSKVGF